MISDDTVQREIAQFSDVSDGVPGHVEYNLGNDSQIVFLVLLWSRGYSHWTQANCTEQEKETEVDHCDGRGSAE